MTAATLTAPRPGVTVDRAGYAAFTTRTAAQAWQSAAYSRAFQCASPDCDRVFRQADAAFDCCGHNTALPVVDSDDGLWWTPVLAVDLITDGSAS